MKTTPWTKQAAVRAGRPTSCGRLHPQERCSCVACAEARGPSLWGEDPRRPGLYCYVPIPEGAER
jgi:hypothetical protein